MIQIKFFFFVVIREIGASGVVSNGALKTLCASIRLRVVPSRDQQHTHKKKGKNELDECKEMAKRFPLSLSQLNLAERTPLSPERALLPVR